MEDQAHSLGAIALAAAGEAGSLGDGNVEGRQHQFPLGRHGSGGGWSSRSVAPSEGPALEEATAVALSSPGLAALSEAEAASIPGLIGSTWYAIGVYVERSTLVLHNVFVGTQYQLGWSCWLGLSGSFGCFLAGAFLTCCGRLFQDANLKKDLYPFRRVYLPPAVTLSCHSSVQTPTAMMYARDTRV
ncbi:claudin-16 [Crotalus adamanteus]|uniref:Claudin-16 n=1 Tax=Crotalus adamanteus TaxID=8729 RepID=A0AAW1BJ27_CROAD